MYDGGGPPGTIGPFDGWLLLGILEGGAKEGAMLAGSSA